jgi:hypothetical protein
MRISLFPKKIGVTAFALMILAVSTALASPPQEDTDQSDVKGLVIALLPTGFDPAEIEIPKGRYLFHVQNRCRVRDLAYRLEFESGEQVHEVHDKKMQWKKEIDLHPGTYVLSVVDHPDWRSTIRVKPR